MNLPALHLQFPGNDSFTLDVPDLEIPTTGFTCLIGRNGSGKSSYGLELSRRSDSWYYLPQYPENFLYAENLREQLFDLFGMNVDQDSLERQLAKFGFTECAELMDFPFLFMSGGERRRIALACALYANPAHLVLDEPDSGVTTKESMVIVDKINNLGAKQAGLLVISHNRDIISKSAHMICLNQGHVDAQGSLADLTQQPGFHLSNYGIRDAL